jgi:hypothetical protein
MRKIIRRQRLLLSIALLALVLAGGLWWRAAEAQSWHVVGPVDPSWAKTPDAVEVNGLSIYLTFVEGRLTAFSPKTTIRKDALLFGA